MDKVTWGSWSSADPDQGETFQSLSVLKENGLLDRAASLEVTPRGL